MRNQQKKSTFKMEFRTPLYLILYFIIYLIFSGCSYKTKQAKSNEKLDQEISALFKLDYDSVSLRKAELILKKCKKDEYKIGIGNTLNFIGLLYEHQENNNLALEFFNDCLVVRRENKDSIGIGNVKCNIGYTYFKLNEDEKGLPEFLKGTSILEKLNRSSHSDKKKIQNSLGNAYTNYAIYWLTKEEENKFYLWTEKGSNQYLASGDSSSYISTQINLANHYYMVDSIQKAEIIYELAADYFMAKGDEKGLSHAITGKANTALYKGNFDRAEKLFKEAIALHEKTGNKSGVFNGNLNLCYVLIDSERLDEFVPHIEKNSKIFEEEGRFDEKQELVEVIKEFYELKNKPDSISKYTILQYEYANAALSEKTAKQIKSLTKDFDIKQGEARLKEETATSEKNRWQRNSIFAALLVSLFFFWSVRDKLKTKMAIAIEEEKKKTDNAIKNTNIKILSSTLESEQKTRKEIANKLHNKVGSQFVVVNSGIKELTKSLDLKNEDSEKLQKYASVMDEIYGGLREVAHQLNDESKSSLPELVQNFINSFSDLGDTKISLLKSGDFNDVDSKTTSALFEIILELIANSIKYAESSKLSIQLDAFEDELSIAVEDDGKGFDMAKISGSGMGIESIKETVIELGGKYQFDSNIGKGTTILIDIPIS